MLLIKLKKKILKKLIFKIFNFNKLIIFKINILNKIIKIKLY